MHAQFGCRSIGGASVIMLEDIDHTPNREMGGAEGIRVPRPSPRSGNIPLAEGHPKHLTGRPSLTLYHLLRLKEINPFTPSPLYPDIIPTI